MKTPLLIQTGGSPRLLPLLLWAVALCAASVASAASMTWSGATTGTWSNTGVWNSGTVPTSGDDIVLTGTGTLVVDTAAVGTSLSGTTGTLTINEGGSLNLSGAITKLGNGLTINITNSTQANAGTVLQAASIDAQDISVNNTSYFSFGNNITLGNALTLYSAASLTAYGNPTFTQTSGTVTVAGSGNLQGVIIGLARNASGANSTATYNLNGGAILASRIGVSTNQTITKVATNGQLNFNAGTIQNATSGGVLNLQNGVVGSSGSYLFDTSKPLNVVLASTGVHTFNADGANSKIYISPSAQLTGVGGFTKSGVGDLVFTGDAPVAVNDWTGDSTVTAGNIVSDYSVLAGKSAAASGQNTISNAYSANSKLVLNGGGYSMTGRGSANAVVRATSGASAGNAATINIDTTGLVVGQAITGTNGIQNGAYIRRIISGSQLEMSHASSLAIGSGDTLNFGAASFDNTQTINNVELQQSGTITVTPGAGTSTTLLNFGSVSGAGGLIKAGSGVLAITGSGSYSGGTTIQSGTIRLGHANALGSSSGALAVNAGTLDLNGNSITVGALTGSSGGLITSSSNASVTFTASAASSGTYSGSISDGAGTVGLTKTGAGTLTLAGVNSYSGATTISSGTLQISDGSIASSSGITNNAALVYNLSSNARAYANAISGNGSLTKTGSSTLTLSGSNSYSGSTIISAGTLKADHAFALGGTAGAITFSGGTLQYTSNSAGSDWGTRISSSTTAAITIDTNGQNVSLGNLDNSNTAGLTKTAAFGTLTLTGSNSFSGATQLNGGTLKLDYTSNNNSKLADGSALQLYGGTLELAGGSHTESVGSTTLNYGATTIKRSSGSGILSTGSITFTAGAVNFEAGSIATTTNALANNLLSFRATVAGADFATVSSGTIVAFSNYAAWSSAPGSNTAYSGTGNLTLNSAAVQKHFRITTNGNNQSLTLGASITVGGLLFVGADNYTIGDATNSINISILHNYGAGTLTIGKLGGNFTQAGTGKTILANAAAGDNTMSILGGSVQISNDNQIGTGVASGKTLTLNMGTLIASTSGGSFALQSATSINRPITLVNAGTLDVIGGNTFTVPGVISGGGQLTLGSASSNGVFSLTGANTYTGATTLAGGTVSLGVAESVGTSGPLGNSAASNAGSIVLNGGYLQHTASNTNDYSGRFSTAANQKYNIDTNGQNVTWATGLSSSGGDLNKKGTGTLTLSAANTLSGTARIMAGTLALNHTSALQNATVDLNNADTGSLSWAASGDYTLGALTGSRDLDMGSKTVLIGNNNASTTYSGVLSNGALTKIGTGTFTLSGNNSYAGATTVNGGVLAISSINGLGGTSEVNIAGGASLRYTGVAATFAKNITISSSGTGTIHNTGGGLLTLSGTLSKNGRVLRLTGGSFDVTGSIVGASANSDLLVDASTVSLSGSNSYNGPTYIINSGTLNANASNALPTANGRTDVLMDQTGSGNSRLSLGASQLIASLTGAASSSVSLNANTLTVGSASGTSTFAGSISGAGGSLAKDGNSTQVLSGNNIYTGATTVNGGKLLVSGSLSGTTNVNVGAEAELIVNGLVNAASTISVSGTVSGSGSLGALNVQNGGTVSPGNSGVGVLKADSASFANGSIIRLELNKSGTQGGVAGINWDQLQITNGLDLSAASDKGIKLQLAQVATAGWSWDASINQTWSGFLTFTGSTGLALSKFDIDYSAFGGPGTWSVAQSGNQLDLQYLAIPEPNSLGMLLGGFGMLLFAQRIRARRSR